MELTDLPFLTPRHQGERLDCLQQGVEPGAQIAGALHLIGDRGQSLDALRQAAGQVDRA